MLWLGRWCWPQDEGEGGRPIFEPLICKGVTSIRSWRAKGKKPGEGGNLGEDSAAAPEKG